MGNSEVGHLTIGSGPCARPGLPARQPRDRGRLASSRTRRSSPPSGARASAAATCTCSGSSPTAACTRTSTTCARCSSSQGARAWRTGRGSTRSRTAATSRRRPPCATSPSFPTTASRRSRGRYYAMDRDKRWERTQLALDAILHGARLDGEGGSAVELVRAELRRGRHRRVHRSALARGHGRRSTRRRTPRSSSTSAPTGPGS